MLAPMTPTAAYLDFPFAFIEIEQPFPFPVRCYDENGDPEDFLVDQNGVCTKEADAE